MVPLARRSALRPVRCLRQHPPRRYESSKAPGTSPDAHSQAHAHDNTHAHAHHGPVNETLGRNFFLTLAAIPIGISIYQYTVSDSNNTPWLTQVINSTASYKERWTERNALHTAAVEEAGFDKNLFATAEPRKMVDLKFPEQFNTGSPICISAGQQADIGAVIRHYEAQNREAAAKTEKKRLELDLARKQEGETGSSNSKKMV